MFCFLYAHVPQFGCNTVLCKNHILQTLSRALGNNLAIKSSRNAIYTGQQWEMVSPGCFWPFPGYEQENWAAAGRRAWEGVEDEDPKPVGN